MIRKIAIGTLKFSIFVAFLSALTVFSGFLTIYYIFSIGDVIVPDLIGEDTIYAVDLLAERHLKLKTVDQQFDPNIKKGHILAQDPQPGTTVRKNVTVRIILSKGTESSLIPEVLGKRWQDATRMIKQSKFRVGHVAYVHSARTPVDHVIAQTPLSLSESSMGETVDLLVSLGPYRKVMIMPDLVEEQLEYAMQAIGRLGLVLGKIERDEQYPELPPNTVINQVPKPGTLIEEQNIVNLVVSGTGASKDPFQGEILPIRYETLEYSVPLGQFDREVLVMARNAEGSSELFRQFVSSGRNIAVRIPVIGETVVEIYLDGVLDEIKRITPE